MATNPTQNIKSASITSFTLDDNNQSFLNEIPSPKYDEENDDLFQALKILRDKIADLGEDGSDSKSKNSELVEKLASNLNLSIQKNQSNSNSFSAENYLVHKELTKNQENDLQNTVVNLPDWAKKVDTGTTHQFNESKHKKALEDFALEQKNQSNSKNDDEFPEPPTPKLENIIENEDDNPGQSMSISFNSEIKNMKESYHKKIYESRQVQNNLTQSDSPLLTPREINHKTSEAIQNRISTILRPPIEDQKDKTLTTFSTNDQIFYNRSEVNPESILQELEISKMPAVETLVEEKEKGNISLELDQLSGAGC